MQVKVGPSFRWFFIVLFGGLLGAAALYVLVAYEEGQPGHPVGVYLMALGVALVPAALIPALRVRGFVKGAAQARGTVIGVEQRTQQRRSGSGTAGMDGFVTYYRPKVQFTTPDGRTVVFTSASSSETKPVIGSPLKVRYRPDSPNMAELDSAAIWVQPAAVGIVFGLALIVAGVVAYFKLE